MSEQVSQDRFAELTGLDLDEPGEPEPAILLSDEESAQFDNEQSRVSDPRVRMAAAATVFGVAVVGVAALIGDVSPSVPLAGEGEMAATQTGEASQADQIAALEEPRARLETELSLRNQEQIPEIADEELESTPDPQATSSPDSSELPSVITPIASPLPPISRPVEVPQPLLPSPRSASTPPPAPISPQDPQEQLAQLQTVGSYGDGEGMVQESLPPVSDWAQVSGGENPVQLVSDNSRQRQTSVVAGSTAAASLETLLFWSRISDNGERFVVELSESLGGLPSGTKFHARPDRVDETSGFANVTVTALIREDREYRLSEGAIVLRGEAGGPLVAQSYENRRQGRSNVESALLTGLARGATAELTSGVESDFASAVINEITDQIIDDFDNRGRATQDSRGIAWYLPKGTPVQVFVNQSFVIAGTETEAEPLLPSASQASEETGLETAAEPAPLPAPVPSSAQPIESAHLERSGQVPAQRVIEPTTPTGRTVADLLASLPDHSDETAQRSEVEAERHPAAQGERPRTSVQSSVASSSPGSMSAAQSVKLWPGSGVNISFYGTNKIITRAWLDDPGMASVDFDRPLCATGIPDCVEESPSLIHLRLLEGIEFEHLPTANSTLFTVVTVDAEGVQELHAFRIERGTGSPEYHTIQM